MRLPTPLLPMSESPRLWPLPIAAALGQRVHIEVEAA